GEQRDLIYVVCGDFVADLAAFGLEQGCFVRDSDGIGERAQFKPDVLPSGASGYYFQIFAYVFLEARGSYREFIFACRDIDYVVTSARCTTVKERAVIHVLDVDRCIRGYTALRVGDGSSD